MGTRRRGVFKRPDSSMYTQRFLQYTPLYINEVVGMDYPACFTDSCISISPDPILEVQGLLANIEGTGSTS